MSTKRSKNAISLKLTPAEGNGIQAVAFAEDGELKVSLRAAPSMAKPNPAWKEFTLHSTLSPLKPGVEKAALAAVYSFFRSKADKENVEWVVGGVWVNEIDEITGKDLDGGSRVPQPFFGMIGTQMETEPPRTSIMNNLQEATEWIVTGPITALMKDESLTKYSEPLLKSVSAIPMTGVTELTRDELDNGVELPSGKRVLVKNTDYGIDIISLIRRCKAKGKYIFLMGPPGTGKTITIQAAVGDFEVVSCNPSTTRENLVGTFVNIKGEWIWKRGPLLRAMEEGKVLFLDEIGMMDVEEQSTLFSVMDEQRMLEVSENPEYNDGKPVYAKEGFYVILATNPDIPGATIAEPLLSRCSYDPEFTTDFDLVAKIMGPDHEELITVARSMETMRQQGQVGQSLQFRDLMLYLENYNDDGSKLALAALINRIKGESDRSELTDLIQRVMGVGNIPTFRI